MAVIFDIGCNIGNWIEANYNTVDTFIGVEANPQIYEFCQDRFKERWNVRILNFLVAERDNETRPFYVAQSSTGEVSSASLDWVQKSRHAYVETWDLPIKVNTITLDTLIASYGKPKLIKIDVEGYELEVLKGLHQVYPLCFEWCEEMKGRLVECIDRLWNIGFREFHLQYGDDYMYRPSSYIGYDKLFTSFKDLKAERASLWGMCHAR